MKTSRRLLALVLCVLALCTSLVIVHATEERGSTPTCAMCGEGRVNVITSIENRHTGYFPCSHGTGGSDIYDCYTVVTTYDCDNCSYCESWEEDVEDFLYCAGASNR